MHFTIALVCHLIVATTRLPFALICRHNTFTSIVFNSEYMFNSILYMFNCEYSVITIEHIYECKRLIYYVNFRANKNTLKEIYTFFEVHLLRQPKVKLFSISINFYPMETSTNFHISRLTNSIRNRDVNNHFKLRMTEKFISVQHLYPSYCKVILFDKWVQKYKLIHESMHKSIYVFSADAVVCKCAINVGYARLKWLTWLTCLY